VVSINISIFKYFIQTEAYWAGLRVVPILLLANVFLGIYYNQSIWYKLSGKTKFGALIAVSGASLTVLINVLFIPSYGFIACAWATLVVYAFQMILSYFLGQKHYKIPYNTKKFAIYVGGAILIYFLFSLMRTLMGLEIKDSHLGILFVGNLMILIYLVGIFIFEKGMLKRS
jgi:O-antigen/teichoic acid export membrane protein